jgi:hypothetical protein
MTVPLLLRISKSRLEAIWYIISLIKVREIEVDVNFFRGRGPTFYRSGYHRWRPILVAVIAQIT